MFTAYSRDGLSENSEDQELDSFSLSRLRMASRYGAFSEGVFLFLFLDCLDKAWCIYVGVPLKLLLSSLIGCFELAEGIKV